MLPCNVWEIWVHWFTHISITLTMFYNLNDINPVLNCYWNSRETDPRRWAVVLQLQKTTVKKLICRWDSIDSVPPSKIKVGRFFSATLLRRSWPCWLEIALNSKFYLCKVIFNSWFLFIGSFHFWYVCSVCFGGEHIHVVRVVMIKCMSKIWTQHIAAPGSSWDFRERIWSKAKIKVNKRNQCPVQGN